jgi:S-adenosylhomocysteine hydrolase
VHHLASDRAPVGLSRFPAELDDLIARTKLGTLGIELDAPTAAQLRFRDQWSVGDGNDVASPR